MGDYQLFKKDCFTQLVGFHRTAGPMRRFENGRVHNSKDRRDVDKAVKCAHVHAVNRAVYFTSAANRKRLTKRVQ